MAESLLAPKDDEKEWRYLQGKQQELELELRGLTSNIDQLRTGEAAVGSIPSTTQVEVSTELNHATGAIELVMSTNNDTVIKSVLIFSLEDSGLFKGGESHVIYPPTPQKSVRVPLRPGTDVPVQLRIQAVVGAREASAQFHVFEMVQNLPRFAMYARVPQGSAPGHDTLAPRGQVTFRVAERAQRVGMWMRQAFFAGSAPLSHGDRVNVTFVCLRDKSQLLISMVPDGGGKVTVSASSMELAAAVVQDMATDMSLTELESEADFPEELGSFREVLEKVEEYNAIRLKLGAEMADASNLVKTLVIKAEDARILGSMEDVKGHYSELYRLNDGLIAEYTKRAQNHANLLAALKEVNQMIQRASRLRVGAAKARVVAECRAAIKQNRVKDLWQIITTGHSPSSA
jgi:Bardet-Biedl syndrome 2 protein